MCECKGKKLECLDFYGEYWVIRDIYHTKAQRSSISRLQQGCDNLAEIGNLNLLLSGANSGAASGTNTALALVFSKKPSQFCTPLDFELLTSRDPFHPSSFGDLLEYDIVFADRSQVLMTTDGNANYSLNNIALQFENV